MSRDPELWHVTAMQRRRIALRNRCFPPGILAFDAPSLAIYDGDSPESRILYVPTEAGRPVREVSDRRAAVLQLTSGRSHTVQCGVQTTTRQFTRR